MKLKYTKDGIFAYRRTLMSYFLSMLKHVLPAIVLGAVINNVSDKIEKRFKWTGPTLMIFVQLFLSAIVLFLIETKLSRFTSYDEEWQGTTPGLFFAAVFFGVQTKLYENITKSFSFFSKKLATF